MTNKRFYVLSLVIVTILACALVKTYRQKRLNYLLLRTVGKRGNTSLVKSLLDQVADVNVEDKKGRTVLLRAVMLELSDAAKVLNRQRGRCQREGQRRIHSLTLGGV